MQEINGIKYYSPLEEKINIFSHAIGLFLSIIATILLVKKSIELGGVLSLVSALVFGFSLMALYAASTFYHSARKADLRRKLRVIGINKKDLSILSLFRFDKFVLGE